MGLVFEPCFLSEKPGELFGTLLREEARVDNARSLTHTLTYTQVARFQVQSPEETTWATCTAERQIPAVFQMLFFVAKACRWSYGVTDSSIEQIEDAIAEKGLSFPSSHVSRGLDF